MMWRQGGGKEDALLSLLSPFTPNDRHLRAILADHLPALAASKLRLLAGRCRELADLSEEILPPGGEVVSKTHGGSVPVLVKPCPSFQTPFYGVGRGVLLKRMSQPGRFVAPSCVSLAIP
jgi:hypothetical protein